MSNSSINPASNSSNNDFKVNNNGGANNNETSSDKFSSTNEIQRSSSTIESIKNAITSTETITNDATISSADLNKASNNTKALDNAPTSTVDNTSAAESSDCVVKTEEIWTNNSSSAYPFGPYPPKPAKTYEEHALDPALFNDPSMKLARTAAATTTAAPVNYYGQPPIAVISNNNNGGTPDKPQTLSPSVSSPQAMMTTFNSKTISSTPKRYKCEICQKRFTRPSSLQTHMYSHTGEKLDGCGRHFSVVSNLRRHQKIHGNNNNNDGSPNVTSVTPSTN
ncbi:13773_t:CDS:2 [Entrophospora sp. SA101]|nr:13773_t:CDS:2 [Entrophospora sp. SA101]